MKRFEKIIGIGMLVFAIGFNLWLYRLERAATIDPNDNAFQFALVDRTNQIWDFAQQRCAKNLSFVICHLSFLIDHWVPNWAEGYNLPYYYSHIPQIIIVGSYRFLSFFSQFSIFNFQFSLFQHYHWIIYFLLSLFPLSVFLSLRLIRLPWLAAGIGAILATHISTDGLYGLDPPSFLWRGYGLSSQLFAMIWMPLALAFAWQYFHHNTRFWSAVFSLTMTAMGHLGLGMIAMLSLIPLAIGNGVFTTNGRVSYLHLSRLFLLAGTMVFFLSYWIVPIVLSDNYHNISFWDPPWKFASFGAKETITRLLNGDLFDWGRGPWMTVLVIIGLIASAWPKKPESRSMNYESWKRNTSKHNSQHSYFILHTSYFNFTLLFVFWLLMYFGRTTWDGLIDFIPGMKEFHLSRFIVGVHAAGLFLMPIGLWTIIERFQKTIKIIIVITIITIIGIPTYQQTMSYASHNDRLIAAANENRARGKAEEEALFAKLRSLPPGRVFAGRGGWWGKDFRVAETPWYMHLSTYGIPTVLWLPQTWSPNSDVEQYFSEDQAKDYDLFGIRYVAAPPKQETQKFWKLIDQRETWKLYEIENVRYFATGIRPAIVATSKRDYGNVVRQWIQSDAHTKGLYPELTFAKDYPRQTGLPNFKMLDEVTYRVPDGSTHNLFQEPPWYQNPTNPTNNPIRPIIENEEVEADMIFKARVDVPENCQECIVILKQSFHPNWKVRIDGEPAQTFTVFPFFLATLVPSGTHEIAFSYEPSRLKLALLLAEFTALMALFARRRATRTAR